MPQKERIVFLCHPFSGEMLAHIMTPSCQMENSQLPKGFHYVSFRKGTITPNAQCMAYLPTFGIFGGKCRYSKYTIHGGCLKWWYPTTIEVFLLKMIILWWRLGVPPFKETPTLSIWEHSYLTCFKRFFQLAAGKGHRVFGGLGAGCNNQPAEPSKP